MPGCRQIGDPWTRSRTRPVNRTLESDLPATRLLDLRLDLIPARQLGLLIVGREFAGQLMGLDKITADLTGHARQVELRPSGTRSRVATLGVVDDFRFSQP